MKSLAVLFLLISNLTFADESVKCFDASYDHGLTKDQRIMLRLPDPKNLLIQSY